MPHTDRPSPVPAVSCSVFVDAMRTSSPLPAMQTVRPAASTVQPQLFNGATRSQNAAPPSQVNAHPSHAPASQPSRPSTTDTSRQAGAHTSRQAGAHTSRQADARLRAPTSLAHIFAALARSGHHSAVNPASARFFCSPVTATLARPAPESSTPEADAPESSIPEADAAKTDAPQTDASNRKLWESVIPANAEESEARGARIQALDELLTQAGIRFAKSGTMQKGVIELSYEFKATLSMPELQWASDEKEPAERVPGEEPIKGHTAVCHTRALGWVHTLTARDYVATGKSKPVRTHSRSHDLLMLDCV